MHVYKTEISAHTKNKNKIEQFENYLSINLTRVQHLLETKTVKFNSYFIFLIQEPKYRIVMSQTIKDKLINHLVARYIVLEAFENSLIDANVATRKDRGTHYGRQLLQKYILELKKEKKEIYYLKCDIRKYFYNINHEVLKKILRTKIKDKDALELLDKIIESAQNPKITEDIEKVCQKEIERVQKLNISEKEKRQKIENINHIPRLNIKGRGIPIGNMTSQAFAIIYLNELDHYIKEKLHIKYYLRYMDDFVLLSTDKKRLQECKKIISKKLETEYQLELNPKTQIGLLKNGLDFLGFRFILQNNKLYLKLRTQVKKRFKRRMKYLYHKCLKGEISKEKFQNVKGSYYGHLLPGNTHYLWKNITDKYNMEELPNDIGKKVKI